MGKPSQVCTVTIRAGEVNTVHKKSTKLTGVVQYISTIREGLLFALFIRSNKSNPAKGTFLSLLACYMSTFTISVLPDKAGRWPGYSTELSRTYLMSLFQWPRLFMHVRAPRRHQSRPAFALKLDYNRRDGSHTRQS